MWFSWHLSFWTKCIWIALPSFFICNDNNLVKLSKPFTSNSLYFTSNSHDCSKMLKLMIINNMLIIYFNLLNYTKVIPVSITKKLHNILMRNEHISPKIKIKKTWKCKIFLLYIDMSWLYLLHFKITA